MDPSIIASIQLTQHIPECTVFSNSRCKYDYGVNVGMIYRI